MRQRSGGWGIQKIAASGYLKMAGGEQNPQNSKAKLRFYDNL